MAVGTHILAELYGCPGEKLTDLELVRELMRRIVREAGMQSVGEKFYRFEPTGVSGVILLTESHFSIHTWPEKDVLAADIFSCSGRENAMRALELLKAYFQPRKLKRRIVTR